MILALDDQQTVIRSAALAAIQLMPQEWISNELVNKVISLFSDKDKDVRENAIKGVAS